MKLLHLLAIIGASAVLSQGNEAEIDILQGDPDILEEEPNILQQDADALQENHDFILTEPKAVPHSPEIYDSVEQVADDAGRTLVGFKGRLRVYGKPPSEPPSEPPREPSSEPPGVFKLHFFGPTSKKVKNMFINVTNVVNSVIKSRPSFQLRKKLKLRDVCNFKNLTGKAVLNPMTLDSIPLFIGQRPTDGVGGVLASARTCLSYTIAENLRRVAVAAVVYDPADINDDASFQIMYDTLLHETFHALGFGLTWGRYVPKTLGSPGYVGPNALSEYHSLLPGGDEGGFVDSIPLETLGQGSAYGAHWRTSSFGDELMVAFHFGAKCILSNLTMKVFEDLGYSINYDSPFIEPYTIPTAEERKNLIYGRGRDGVIIQAL